MWAVSSENLRYSIWSTIWTMCVCVYTTDAWYYVDNFVEYARIRRYVGEAFVLKPKQLCVYMANEKTLYMSPADTRSVRLGFPTFRFVNWNVIWNARKRQIHGLECGTFSRISRISQSFATRQMAFVTKCDRQVLFDQLWYSVHTTIIQPLTTMCMVMQC